MSSVIRLLILCSLGLSSAVLLRRVSDAARQRGIPLEADSASAWDSPGKLPSADVILLEPQVAHLRDRLEEHVKKSGAVLDTVDTSAFLTMDGGRVLDQVLRLISVRKGAAGWTSRNG